MNFIDMEGTSDCRNQTSLNSAWRHWFRAMYKFGMKSIYSNRTLDYLLMIKYELLAWELKTRLSFSISFIYVIGFFKSAFIKTIPYISISAFHLMKGFWIHKSMQNSQMSVFFLPLGNGEVQILQFSKISKMDIQKYFPNIVIIQK